MKIIVLGMGCKKCMDVYENVKKAVEELKIDAEIAKVTDAAKIAEYVISTPGLVVDDEVIFEGNVPSVEEIKNELSKL
ncbi:redox-active disulfide protein 2 [Methanococcus maripaludis C5]|uniref:Thioredoxin n=1 Tax=Methanococcus maripaludis (strain C5 / ATCC BAA-1333) TaxID=402880 RepID=A4FY44_METM5|nr:thioredoxin family protein [Methanococcus maripaludis]ABO35128.1 redox-active disulfide protein 2 [Methanococcus maripaludis C5]